jgi:hypothetical protein
VLLNGPTRRQVIPRTVHATSPRPRDGVCFTLDSQKLAVPAQNERAVRLWYLDRLRERLKAMNLDW